MSDTKLFSAIEMMLHTNRLHKAMIDSMVREIGIHRTQHRILMHLAKREKFPSQKELAEHLDITPAAVAVAIKKIEKDGYIRRTHGKDIRFNEIEITEKGRELVSLTREMFSSADLSMFEGFSEEELDNYISYLEKIQSNINSKLKVKGKSNEKMV